MTIYVNGRFLTQRLSGMQRWSEELLTALDKSMSEGRLPVLDIVVLTPRLPIRERSWTSIKVRQVGKNKGHLWEQIDLFVASKTGLLVNLMSSGPLFHDRQAVTFHDANVLRNPQLFSFGYRTLHGFLRRRLSSKAKALLTVSQFSASELSSIFSISEAKFTVIPNAADHLERVEGRDGILTRLALSAGEYALCVGNQTKNKNVATAIAAFQMLGRPDLKLVLVGAADKAIFGSETLSLDDNVVAAGYVTDGELQALYRDAAFLCFPSLYEGFGVPVLEAMQNGCPVIASNTSAIPEVAGPAALLVDPLDVDAMAGAMADILNEPGKAAQLRELGLERARLFSWNRSASIFHGFLTDLQKRLTGEARSIK